MRIRYEEKYHKGVHAPLITNELYYWVRTNLALLRYFDDIKKNQKVFEFGCGLGQNIFLLPNAIGYDISKFCLKFAKKKGIKIITNIKDIKNDSFDVVLCSHVLEHVENPYKILKILKNKLKVGGKLILILPIENHGKINFDLDINQHLYCWNFRTINNLLITMKFKVIENKYIRGGTSSKLTNLFFSIFPLKRSYLILYNSLCKLASIILGTKEMKIVAIKV